MLAGISPDGGEATHTPVSGISSCDEATHTR